MADFNQILREGKIVDNKRVKALNMKDVLNTIAQDSESFKCAVGYFYIEGLIEIINSLKELKEIKILMGYDTSKPTKEELVKAFKKTFNDLEDDEQTRPALKLFYQLIKEYKSLKIRVYFGDEKNPERLHSKSYLFLRNMSTTDLLDRYKAGVIGSSNLTPSGLVGNTELNTIITEGRDLETVELWFDDLWEKGTEDFDKLLVSEAIVEAIEKSKFKKVLKDTYVYIEPKEFFKILIKYLKADYLFEEFKKSKLLQFQYVDFIRILNNFNSKGYRGCFLTSSVGLGKSYVAAQVAKYFSNNGKKVLVIVPAGLMHNEEQWPRYLKEFGIYDKVHLVSMGKLQENPDEIKIKKYVKNYGLIVVDEVHNYRNPNSYRNRNLKKIIDENGNSKVLFLTATPINTSLDDLLNLIKLFHRKGRNLLFDSIVRELSNIIKIFKKHEYEELEDAEKEKLSRVQEQIEREMFVKSTRETIKTSPDYIDELKSFAGVDISKLSDPNINEIKYELHPKYKIVVNGIVNFITSLSAAHLRLLDPDKGAYLGGFFKWILYKRFESDISSYYLTLKRLSKKNTMILKAVESQNISNLEDDDYEDEIIVKFNIEFKEKLDEVIGIIKSGQGEEHLEILEELRSDTELINQEIRKIEPFLEKGSDLLFTDDEKIYQLSKIISNNKSKKVLIFTEYKDTLKAIKEYLGKSNDADEIKFIDSTTDNKQSIIERFNDKKEKLRILISTDTLSEGFNISGADMVINFDIPYNPVRIIQRIGRATRLDTPKDIEVLNFRPDDNIDVELKLVEKMELRIKDIIRFIGVEYRIWFEAEKELLSERRKKDKKIYLEILDKIRGSMREGSYEGLNKAINYSKPVLILLQKVIKKYKLKKEDLIDVKIPTGKNYTLLQGSKALSMLYQDAESYNEEALLDKEVKETKKQIFFETIYKDDLGAFRQYQNEKKKENLRMGYFNDKVDTVVNHILDYINTEKIDEMYPDIATLKSSLEQVHIKCGSQTERVLKTIRLEIKSRISDDKIEKWISILEESFTKLDLQTTLVPKKETIFAIGFIEE